MTRIEMTEFDRIMADIEDMEKTIKAMTKALDARKEDAKTFMEERGMDETVTERFKAIYREVITNRFDTTAFKKDHPRLYKDYVKDSVTKPFKHYVID